MSHTLPRLHLIYARARNGVIGHKGQMPWHIPEDLAHFRRMTQGCPVIMGRKTWDSLPARFRPLPGRRNIVLTYQSNWHADGALVAHTLDEALHHCAPARDAWVIGGAEIYRLALPIADSVVVTEIDADFAGDAFAPLLDAHWQECSREPLHSSNGLDIAFVTYRRRTSAQPV